MPDSMVHQIFFFFFFASKPSLLIAAFTEVSELKVSLSCWLFSNLNFILLTTFVVCCYHCNHCIYPWDSFQLVFWIVYFKINSSSTSCKAAHFNHLQFETLNNFILHIYSRSTFFLFFFIPVTLFFINSYICVEDDQLYLIFLNHRPHFVSEHFTGHS